MIGIALTISAAPAEPTHSANLTEATLRKLQVDEQVFLGVIAKHADLSQALEGIKVVIDLRYPFEGVYDELGKLRGLDIRHVNIPTSSDGPSLRELEALEAELAREPREALLIHDSNGHRSAMIWAAHLIRSGHDFEQAIAAVASFYEPARLRPKLKRIEHALDGPAPGSSP